MHSHPTLRLLVIRPSARSPAWQNQHVQQRGKPHRAAGVDAHARVSAILYTSDFLSILPLHAVPHSLTRVVFRLASVCAHPFSREQQEDLANFHACVGNNDRTVALQYLKAHNWDLMVRCQSCHASILTSVYLAPTCFFAISLFLLRNCLQNTCPYIHLWKSLPC